MKMKKMKNERKTGGASHGTVIYMVVFNRRFGQVSYVRAGLVSSLIVG